jgi:dihydrofolate reductase
MPNIIWMISVSVDSYMEGPNREIDWRMVDDELFRHLNGWPAGAGGCLEERVTYQLMAEFWPTADQDSAATPTVVEFAAIWRGVPNVVYSRTLERADWDATVAHDVVPARWSPSSHSPVETSSWGAATGPRSSSANDLIDEYRLGVHPIVIGGGTPMLRPSNARVPLRSSRPATLATGS